MSQPEDLKSGDFPSVKWEPGKLADPLAEIYQHVVGKAWKTQQWYFTKRRSKKRWGYVLRIGAIISGGIAGITPVLASISEHYQTWDVPSGLSAVFVVVTGLCVMVDKFAGFTSGWVRYVLTAQQIGQQLEDFQFGWEKRQLSFEGNPPTAEQAQQCLSDCRQFAAKIGELVAEETRQWAADFESALKQIEAAAKAVPKPETAGAVDVTVMNGDQSQVTHAGQSQGGWTLQVDDGSEEKRAGRRATLSKLTPGVHKIRVTGQIAGKPVEAETSVKVLAGEVAEVELELVGSS